jgi:PleD family two-component response regulator
MVAFHSRECLVEIFKECYDDHRDVKQVLDMIARQAGYVKLMGETLVVVLDWIERAKHRKAAERLCQELNRKNITLAASRLKVKLFFHISKVPRC